MTEIKIPFVKTKLEEFPHAFSPDNSNKGNFLYKLIIGGMLIVFLLIIILVLRARNRRRTN